MDLAKLISLVTSRAAAGIAVVAVTAGAGGAVALTSSPTSSHQHNQTVLTVNDTSTTTSESETESDNSSNDTHSGSSTSNHGDVVTQAVSSCQSSASAAGDHGIGPCVSKVASSNGQTHRHTTSTSTTSGG